MLYVELVNQLPTGKAYATHSIFILAENRTLNPMAIELCFLLTRVGLGSTHIYTPSGEDHR
jgi:hypothetical protein